MLAVVFLLVIALVSLLIARIATIALTASGLPVQSARFQARSALTGVGFTTRETEQVVNHPFRRRVIMALMLIGNVGFVSAVAGLLGGFLGAGERSLFRAALLVGGLAATYALSRSPVVDRALARISRRLLDRYTHLDVRDYGSLLHLYGDYAIRELAVRDGDWLAARTLDEIRLKDEGLLVIGVLRGGGRYEGVPRADTVLHPGDTAIVYGRGSAFAALAEREPGTRGDVAHVRRVIEERQVERRERRDQPLP